MKEKSLLKMSLIGSIVGIVILMIVSVGLEARNAKLDIVDNEKIIDGVITGIVRNSAGTSLSIARLESNDMMVFDANLSFSKGDYVEVIGNVGEYGFIPDKIILK